MTELDANGGPQSAGHHETREANESRTGTPSIRDSGQGCCSKAKFPLYSAGESRSLRRSLYALLIFVAFSCLFLIPIHFAMSHRLITQKWDLPDASQWIWFYSWWPYAISHWINPIMSYRAWAPTGVNLAMAVSTPFTSLVLSPVTYVFGPIVTYNVSLLAALITSAWCAYLLCYKITGSFLPSVTGGWIFAFSPYVLNDMNGKPSLVTLWSLPIMLLLAIKYLKGEIGPRMLVLLSCITLTSLFYTTAEICVTFVFMSAMTFLLAICLYRGDPVYQRLIKLGALALITLMMTAVLAAPFAYYGFFGPGAFTGPIHQPYDFSNDLLSLVIPSSFIWVGGSALHPEFLHLHGWQIDDYLGPAVLLTMVLFFIQFRHQKYGKLIIVMVVFSLILSLGPYLAIYGHPTAIGLPFCVLSQIPVLDKAIPDRYCLYAYMGISLAVALWGSRKPNAFKWLMLALCVLTLMPDIISRHFSSTPDNPRFFATSGYRSYIRKNENVILLPYGINGDSLAWQAEDNFYFRIAGGYFYLGQPWNNAIVDNLSSGTARHGFYRRFQRFAKSKGIQAIIVSDAYVAQCQSLLSHLHTQPVKIAGVEIFNIK
jgi:hypothetical protein